MVNRKETSIKKRRIRKSKRNLHSSPGKKKPSIEKKEEKEIQKKGYKYVQRRRSKKQKMGLREKDHCKGVDSWKRPGEEYLPKRQRESWNHRFSYSYIVCVCVCVCVYEGKSWRWGISSRETNFLFTYEGRKHSAKFRRQRGVFLALYAQLCTSRHLERRRDVCLDLPRCKQEWEKKID